MSSIGKATGWGSLQHGIRLAAGLITSIGLARHLGPDSFGAYQSLLSWALFFVALSAGGLQSVVIQRLAISHSPETILGSVFKLRLAWTGLAVLLCTGIPLALNWPQADLIGVAILVPVLAFQMADLPDYLFQSRLEMKPALISRTVGSLVSLAVMGLGILLDQSVWFFLVAFALEQFLGFFLIWIANQKSGVPFSAWRFDSGVALDLSRAAWPMLISTISLVLYTRIDLVMLKSLSSAEQTGFYAASSRLSQLWTFVPMILVNAAFPLLARTRQKDSQAYAQQLRALFSLLGALGLVLALSLSIGAPWISTLLLGESFRPVAPMLAIQGFVALCYFLRTGLDRWLVTENLTRFSLIIHAGTALTNIGLNFILVPRLGGSGAAIASLAAMSFGLVVIPLFIPATRPGGLQALRGTLGLFHLMTAKGRRACVGLLRSGG
jgi:PST family polysaccharide transporter